MTTQQHEVGHWFGLLPNGWSAKAIKYGFALIGSGTTPPSGEARYYGGTIPWVNTSELRENVINEFQSFLTDEALQEFSALRIYPAGTVLFAMYGATIGRVAILGLPATVNQAVCALANPTVLEARFTFYCLQASRDVLNALASGGGQPNLNAEKVREHRIPCPNSDMQRSISSFLDCETFRIDALVAAKQRLLDLLAEKRKAIIATAVTRGLDPNVKLRDSGVPWLGEIPAHWDVWRSKRLFSHRNERAQPGGTPLTASQEYGVIPQGEFMGKVGRRVVQVETGTDILKQVEQNDFVMSMRSFQGGIELSRHAGAVSSAYVVLVPSTKIFVPFFALLFKSTSYIQALRSTSSLVRDGQALRYENFSLVDLPLPPYQEQIYIAEVVEQQTNRLKELTDATHQTIILLKERRSALIAAAVTGQLDVTNDLTERATA